jgi:hypothetical protein
MTRRTPAFVPEEYPQTIHIGGGQSLCFPL